MLVEQLIPRRCSLRSLPLLEQVRKCTAWLKLKIKRESERPFVVFCYDFIQGETLEDWRRRNPDSLPPTVSGRVVWVLPERPLDRHSFGGELPFEGSRT